VREGFVLETCRLIQREGVGGAVERSAAWGGCGENKSHMKHQSCHLLSDQGEGRPRKRKPGEMGRTWAGVARGGNEKSGHLEGEKLKWKSCDYSPWVFSREISWACASGKKS